MEIGFYVVAVANTYTYHWGMCACFNIITGKHAVHRVVWIEDQYLHCNKLDLSRRLPAAAMAAAILGWQETKLDIS